MLLSLANSTAILLAKSGGSQQLADAIRNFVGPILLLIIGIIAITFLVKREMTQFIIFLVIAIAVALIFYAPGIISSLAGSVANDVNTRPWKG